jgi:DNA-binding transcriptional LysR family regulator
MKYRFKDIEHFIEMCSCRTIMEAAVKVGISQPALSESLKRLESDVGSILFYRSRSGIQLTPTGKMFQVKALKLLNAISSLDITPGEKQIFSGKVITIGCHATVAQYMLPKALAHIAKVAPDYKIELRHDLSRNIQLEIQRGHIDVGIIINPVAVPDIVIKKLASDVVRIWCKSKNFDHSTVVCNLALVQTQNILRKWKNKPSRIVNSDSLELICRLTNEGLGFGILPERAVQMMGFDFKINDSLPSYNDQFCMVHRPEFGLNKAEALVCQALKISMWEG